MHPALLVRFRPTGPWRFGPDSGARDRVDSVCHSDTVYSAVSGMMLRLGLLEEWFAATTPNSSIRFSSLFPFHGETLFLPPPRNLWPPQTSSRVRWDGAQFVPVSVVETLLAGTPLDEDRWMVDGPSSCLVPTGGKFRGGGPWRVGMRSAAAVDREEGAAVEPHLTACIEFSEEAGMWGLVGFDSEEVRDQWGHKLRSALRLLADTGIGGERSRGWGRSSMPSIREGKLTDLLFRRRDKKNGAENEAEPEPVNAHWLLSLFSPAADDSVNWKAGCYQLVNRTGRIDSPERTGDLKQTQRMICEGSVLVSPTPLRGTVRDVAPEGFPHPVYRSGCALSIPIRWGKVTVVERPLPPIVEPVPPAEPEPEPIVEEMQSPAPIEEPPAEPGEEPGEPVEPLEDPIDLPGDPGEPLEFPEDPDEEPAEPIEPPHAPIEEPEEPGR